MAEKIWEPIQVQYCDRAGCDVALEAMVVYPAEFMPDQPGRVLTHRCSKAADCAQSDKATCVWAGTNPAYDPFQR